MISKLIGRSAALLTVAFFLAISANAFCQVSSVLSASKIEDLVTSGNAGELRNHLLVSLNAKIERNVLAESIKISDNNQSLVCEIVSQLVSYKRESVELVCIRLTQGAKTRLASLVQYANGDLAELQGNGLVTYSTTKEVKGCAGDGGSRCSGCNTGANAALARSGSLSQKVSGFFKASNSGCLACIGDIDDVIECITGHRQ